MFKHILLPTDGTEASLKAARLTMELSKRLGARLTVLHVVPPTPRHRHRGDAAAAEKLDPIEANQQHAAECLNQIAELAAAHEVVCNCSEVTDSAPYRAIVDFARQHECDLIVMGSHGKHGLERLVMGSQTHKVLLASHLPVLVCP